MANRHSHKKVAGESPRPHGEDRRELPDGAATPLDASRQRGAADVDLVAFRYFGMPLTLATTQGPFVHAVAVLRVTPHPSPTYPLPLAAWLLPRGVN